MSSFHVREIIERLERMVSEMQDLQHSLHDYHGKMKQTIEEIKREGLPQEFVSRFESDHLEVMSRYFDGLAKHLENESIPYTRDVILKTQDLRSSM